jgi:hypothetical protein
MTAPSLSRTHDNTRRATIGMTLHQFRYDLRALLRNRQAQFFTLTPSDVPGDLRFDLRRARQDG